MNQIQIRHYIWACWGIKYFSEQQWLWSHEQNICSNASHRLKRATDLRDCVSALCLQSERNMSLHACAQAHHMYMMALCSLSAYCFDLKWKELPFCLSQIHYSELHRGGTSGAVSGSRECFYVLPDCKASLLTALNMTDVWSPQHDTANISSVRWTFGSFKWMLQNMNHQRLS